MIIYKNLVFIHSIFSKNFVLKTKLPIILTISNQENEYFYIESEFYNICAVAQYYEDIVLELNDTISYMWQECVVSVEELTSSEAILTRKRLSKYFHRFDIDEKN